MRDATLLELAARWEREADTQSHVSDGPDGARDDSARRQTLRECADSLRVLVRVIGDPKGPAAG